MEEGEQPSQDNIENIKQLKKEVFSYLDKQYLEHVKEKLEIPCGDLGVEGWLGSLVVSCACMTSIF